MATMEMTHEATSMMAGAWSAWSFTVTPEAQHVFKEALKGFAGVHYTPLAFAKQVVAGTNYAFLCKGKAVYPNAPETTNIVYIYQPLKGDPHITHITQIHP